MKTTIRRTYYVERKATTQQFWESMHAMDDQAIALKVANEEQAAKPEYSWRVVQITTTTREHVIYESNVINLA